LAIPADTRTASIVNATVRVSISLANVTPTPSDECNVPDADVLLDTVVVATQSVDMLPLPPTRTLDDTEYLGPLTPTIVTLKLPVAALFTWVNDVAASLSIVSTSVNVSRCPANSVTATARLEIGWPAATGLPKIDVDDCHSLDLVPLSPIRLNPVNCAPMLAPTNVTLVPPVFAMFVRVTDVSSAASNVNAFVSVDPRSPIVTAVVKHDTKNDPALDLPWMLDDEIHSLASLALPPMRPSAVAGAFVPT
jgi:hypothetical protein